MNYFVLRRASHVLFPCLLVLSIVVLYRGHNLPGGGFIGGLMAATAFLLLGVGESMKAARARLRIDPVALMGCGLAVALLSGVPAQIAGKAFMTALWLPGFSLPLLGSVHLGTPLLFDCGVYFTVIGFVLHTTFSLVRLAYAEDEEGEENGWKE